MEKRSFSGGKTGFGARLVRVRCDMRIYAFLPGKGCAARFSFRRRRVFSFAGGAVLYGGARGGLRCADSVRFHAGRDARRDAAHPRACVFRTIRRYGGWLAFFGCFGSYSASFSPRRHSPPRSPEGESGSQKEKRSRTFGARVPETVTVTRLSPSRRTSVTSKR